MLSVIIITKNEASHISRCLQSVSWADEIIVLDSGSTDNTVALCKKFTALVFETDWPGFGPQKQRALDKAQYDWVLSIDADEWVTAELKEEILSVVKSTDTQGYNIPRLSQYCGREMKHGGWWPDHVLRLFQRPHGQFTNDVVHERIIVNGTINNLKHHLKHDAFVDTSEVLHKINQYSSLGAEKLLSKGKQTSFPLILAKTFWTFFRTYIIKTAFLDGRQGFMLSVSNAEGTYYKYLKLLDLQSKTP
jgi:glycosyltransferase involved in cell wall biosynthesis